MAIPVSICDTAAMAYLQNLKLNNFRCYGSASLKELEAGFIVLHGANGAGKTNVLEAVSILTPGRGLRGAKPLEIQNNDAPQGWAVSSSVKTAFGPVQLGTGIDRATEKRIIRINGQNAKSQAVLGEYLSCVWLTPQMDRLFMDSSRERRTFLDRLIFAFDPGHSGRSARYANAMSQRSKLLRDGRNDPVWIKGLEEQMSEAGVAIAAARLEFMERLRSAASESVHPLFPRAELRVTGTIEELLQNAPALEVEELFKYQLEQSRPKDAIVGGAATGPHKSDLSVVYSEKNMPASQCSTGEQKALLIGLILAHARLIDAERGAPPLLLLDEVAAHLDEERRAVLYGILGDLGGQVWLTGTEAELFKPLHKKARFIMVQDGALSG